MSTNAKAQFPKEQSEDGSFNRWTTKLSKMDPMVVSEKEHLWVVNLKGPSRAQLPSIAVLKEGVPNVVPIYYFEGRYSVFEEEPTR